MLSVIHATHVDILETMDVAHLSSRTAFRPNRTDGADYATTLSTLVDKPGHGAIADCGSRPPISSEYLDLWITTTDAATLHRARPDRSIWDGTAMAAMEREHPRDRLSACDAMSLAERILTPGLDTKPDAGPSLAVYDEDFLKGGVRFSEETDQTDIELKREIAQLARQAVPDCPREARSARPRGRRSRRNSCSHILKEEISTRETNKRRRLEKGLCFHLQDLAGCSQPGEVSTDP